MDDIVERLREHIAVVVDNKGHVFEDEHLCDIAADRIEALEARIAKADALAEVAKRAVKLSQQDDTFKLYAMEPIWQALADYRDGTDTLAAAPERVWMDPDIKFPECEKQYGCDVEYVRADMLKGQTMSDNTDDMNDFVLLAMARDEAVSRVKELEAKLAKAVEGFEELARLGNGDRYGNSFGNLIAQKYIAELTGGKDE